MKAPAARLAKRAGAHPAALDDCGQQRRIARIAAFPTGKPTVAEDDPVERGKSRRSRSLKAFRRGVLGREVGGAKKAKAIDQNQLLVRSPADQPAIVGLS